MTYSYFGEVVLKYSPYLYWISLAVHGILHRPNFTVGCPGTYNIVCVIDYYMYCWHVLYNHLGYSNIIATSYVNPTTATWTDTSSLICGWCVISLMITWVARIVISQIAVIYWFSSNFQTFRKCPSDQKPHAKHSDTPVVSTSSSKYFQILPAPPRVLQCTLRLCKSIFRCSWKNLQLWRWIQNALSRIVRFWSSCDLCADLVEISRAAETAAQDCPSLWEQLKPLRNLCGRLDDIFSQ